MQSTVWHSDLCAPPGRSLIDWTIPLAYGEEMGLGTRNYLLETI